MIEWRFQLTENDQVDYFLQSQSFLSCTTLLLQTSGQHIPITQAKVPGKFYIFKTSIHMKVQ